MSWRHWTENGYGVELYTGKNFDAIREFLIDRSEDDEEISGLKEAEDEYDIADVLGEDVALVIAGHIRSETGYMSFDGYPGCGDTRFEPHLGFRADFPWCYNKKDKELTMDIARSVIERYSNELGISATPEYFEAEYCG